MSLRIYYIIKLNFKNSITILLFLVPAKNINPIAFQGLKNILALNHLNT